MRNERLGHARAERPVILRLPPSEQLEVIEGVTGTRHSFISDRLLSITRLLQDSV